MWVQGLGRWEGGEEIGRGVFEFVEGLSEDVSIVPFIFALQGD